MGTAPPGINSRVHGCVHACVHALSFGNPLLFSLRSFKLFFNSTCSVFLVFAPFFSSCVQDARMMGTAYANFSALTGAS